MKLLNKIDLFIIALIFVNISTTLVYAVDSTKSATKTTTATSSADMEKIQSLKNKLATKVAELRENQTRGFSGEIAALSKSTFTLVTKNGEVKIRLSDDTLIYKLGNQKTEGSIKDLKNTLMVSTLGIYDSEAKQQTANIILIQDSFKYFSGNVTEVNKTSATITIKTVNGETQTLDYEKTTASDEYADKSVKKSGLSRINKEDFIQSWTSPKEDDNQTYSINRLLRIPSDLLKAPIKENPVSSPTPETKPEASISASPRASSKPKASPKT